MKESVSMIDLKANPFCLDDAGVRWVHETLDRMSIEEKAGQVFCPMGFSSDEKVLSGIVNGAGVGGMMYRTGAGEEIQETHRKIQQMAKIPLLLAANTESGGDGLAMEGTGFGKPMAVAAVDEKNLPGEYEVRNPQSKQISATVCVESTSKRAACPKRCSMMYSLSVRPVRWRKKRLNATEVMPTIFAKSLRRISSL